MSALVRSSLAERCGRERQIHGDVVDGQMRRICDIQELKWPGQMGSWVANKPFEGAPGLGIDRYWRGSADVRVSRGLC